jgi:hypothetical protein
MRHRCSVRSEAGSGARCQCMHRRKRTAAALEGPTEEQQWQAEELSALALTLEVAVRGVT